ncbi:hypothetical protein [Gelidibacter salicanalis]|uniref:Uncharacterized protein n=1 Tax=Gelidibacter salicanalis TaxID=291193 RepID=A0A934KVB2_9FLAO|nr:hypothetical protein [Gelidibacter salicanalis]MBJ7881996.1 hypothetical protein [Gelidibacter salicanalis]
MSKTFKKANQDAITVPKPPFDYQSEPETLTDPLLAGYVATGILKTVVNLVSLFKTDTDFKNFDVATDDSEIIAAFKNSLIKNKNWKVFSPAIFPINTVKNNSESYVTGLNNELLAQVAIAKIHLKNFDLAHDKNIYIH